jgi:hypothetical protein
MPPGLAARMFHSLTWGWEGNREKHSFPSHDLGVLARGTPPLQSAANTADDISHKCDKSSAQADGGSSPRPHGLPPDGC